MPQAQARESAGKSHKIRENGLSQSTCGRGGRWFWFFFILLSLYRYLYFYLPHLPQIKKEKQSNATKVPYFQGISGTRLLS